MFDYAKTKQQISCRDLHSWLAPLFFTTQKVRCLLLNPKFQASSLLLTVMLVSDIVGNFENPFSHFVACMESLR